MAPRKTNKYHATKLWKIGYVMLRRRWKDTLQIIKIVNNYGFKQGAEAKLWDLFLIFFWNYPYNFEIIFIVWSYAV